MRSPSTTPSGRSPSDGERVHDGVVRDGYIYFTASTVTSSSSTPHVAVVARHALRGLAARSDGERRNLGWCRGLHFDGEWCWVGFSRIRPTRLRQTVSWVRTGTVQAPTQDRPLPTVRLDVRCRDRPRTVRLQRRVHAWCRHDARRRSHPARAAPCGSPAPSVVSSAGPQRGLDGATVWLTGLSGSGKSAIADSMLAKLTAAGTSGLRARCRQPSPRV